MNVIRKVISVFFVFAAVVVSFNGVLGTSVEAEQFKDMRWRGRIVRLTISASFFSENPAIKTGSDVRGALARSLESWERAANVKFELLDSPKQNVSPSGNSGDGVNLLTIAGSAENILFLGKSHGGIPAATRVFFDKKGNITESDIVLNPTEQFSTDGTFGTFDLESVFVHEIGHLLGSPHIELPGATMYDSVPRNGLYGLAYLRSRTLTETDAAMVRTTYGEPADAVDCCGTIIGTIKMPNGRSARSVGVFLETADGSRVYGSGKTDNAGRVYFSSVPTGNYRIAAVGAKSVVSFERLFSDTIEVTPNEETPAVLTLASSVNPTNSVLIGLNGQLSNAPVPLISGGVSRIYLGIPEKFTEKFRIESTSANISVVRDSISENSQYEGLRVISFEIEIEPDTPDGEYSLVVAAEGFGTAYLPGVISIDRRLDNVRLLPRR